MFENLKVGDEVIVVSKLAEWELRCGRSPKVRTEKVTKVGEKYAYLGDAPFHKSTGHSSHVGIERENGGFDVFPSLEDYEQRLEIEREIAKLKSRLDGNYRPSLAALNKVNVILDEDERDNNTSINR